MVVFQEVPLSAAHAAGPPAEQRFPLRARPPVRALAIASCTALIGSVLLVVAVAAGWSDLVRVLGAGVLLLGSTLAVAALIATRRLRSVVLLDDAGLRLVRQGRTRRIAWSQIENVALRGSRLVFTERSGRSLNVVNPPGVPLAVFQALLAAIQQRLDRDRGYRTSA